MRSQCSQASRKPLVSSLDLVAAQLGMTPMLQQERAG